MVPLDRVDEVLVPQSFTHIPGSGPEVCGLIGLRGRVLTVFDLCALLGERPLDPDDDHRILVVRAADRVVGLAVAEIATSADDATSDTGAGADRQSGKEPRALDLDQLIGSRLA